MRARDARDLSALAQAALRELTDPPLARLIEPADALQMRRCRAGVTVVAYGDRSSVWVARDELEATRIAVERSATYAFVRYGHEVMRGAES